MPTPHLTQHKKLVWWAISSYNCNFVFFTILRKFSRRQADKCTHVPTLTAQLLMM